ncbi:hypothetical protein LX36DRAFT_664788 [Colletotrichum falcatum]|nr:hypothetical protein LX36DRAFT_664788 [Colletotrichum falcatum]
MSNVKFTGNWVITKANASVDLIDLEFPGADKLMNDKTTTAPVGGKSTKAVAYFNNNNPPPKTFTVAQEVAFPAGAHVTLTGGGPNDNVIEATDTVGNRAVWMVVGK